MSIIRQIDESGVEFFTVEATGESECLFLDLVDSVTSSANR